MGLIAEPRELLSVLAADVDVVLGPVGGAAVVTKEADAYMTLRDAGTSVLRSCEPELLRMIDAGTPAAIIYAALLLRTYDPYDPRVLLERYAQDTRGCSIFPGGCMPLPGERLKDAVDYVCAEPWMAPAERIRTRLQCIQHEARWFELPSADELRHAHDRRGSFVDTSAWTYAFAELLIGPKFTWALASERGAIEALLDDESHEVRLYGAALLRAIDPAAGVEVLQKLRSDNSRVPVRPWLRLIPRSRPMAKLAGKVLDWPAWAEPEIDYPAWM